MSGRDEIIRQAMTLTPEDRAYVADRIEQSLSQDGFASPDAAAAWIAEIERRVAAYDCGELQATGIDVALARMQAQLADRRSGKVDA